MNSKLEIKKLSENAKMPTKGSEEAAGYDLYAATTSDVWVRPHQTEKISTDLAIALPKGTFGAIFARSGIATKQGLRPANCVGVIDSDYRGPVIVAIHNDLNDPQLIPRGARVAQLVILPYITPEIIEVDELDKTERGEGGFGHSGLK